MPSIPAFPARSADRLLLLACALTLSLPLAGAGCADKACLQVTGLGTGSTSAATTGGGGMGGAGGAATAGGGGTAGGGDAGPSCPNREEAKALLGTPSCSEAIDSVDSDGDRDGDVCCYEVTTKSTACAREGAR
jgi:hypothetical protein